MTTSSYESLSHAKWDCKYHVVFIPKGRKKALYGKMRKLLGPILRELAGQRGSTIVEGHRGQDHVHMLHRIPPKYAVAEVIGSIKGVGSIIQLGRRCRAKTSGSRNNGGYNWVNLNTIRRLFPAMGSISLLCQAVL